MILSWFQSPGMQIRKRLPINAHPDFDAAAILIRDLPKVRDLTGTRQGYFMGSMMSIWACNKCISGKFQLSDFNYRFIMNMGENCAQRLDGEDLRLLRKTADYLIKKGVISTE